MKNPYQSPYKLPEFECTSPKNASRYSALHAADGEPGHSSFPYTGKKCPVHSISLKKETVNWREWAYWREQYAQPETDDKTRSYAMDRMLSLVTPSNPPEVQSKTHAVRRRPSYEKLLAVSVVSIILAVCMLTCFLAVLL